MQYRRRPAGRGEGNRGDNNLVDDAHEDLWLILFYRIGGLTNASESWFIMYLVTWMSSLAGISGKGWCEIKCSCKEQFQIRVDIDARNQQARTCEEVWSSTFL